MKTCQRCQKTFEIAPEDNEFRAKISPVFNGQTYLIPEPRLCPDCRDMRRLAWRNERNLYKRKCSASGKEIISVFSLNSPYKVYEQSEWWSDRWDPLDYGQDFDFSLPFFDQFNDLLHKVPLVSLWNYQGENAEYNNNCFGLKDSYLNINTDEGERNFYCYASAHSNDISDCVFAHKAELSHECIDCEGIYNCYYCQDVQNSSDCFFSTSLSGCKNCFACHGLRQKQYCLYNQQLSKEEYEEKMKYFKFTHSNVERMIEESQKIYLGTPKKALKNLSCQDCRGNYLSNCQNVKESYDIAECENLKYVNYSPFGTKNSQDAFAVGGGSEWIYEFIGGPEAYNTAFVVNSSGKLSNSYYCLQCCNNNQDLFGCISLKNKKYCILNKQYTKEEYEALIPKIIEHMKQTGEWGEFFPAKMSFYAYNETLANQYYPLDRQQATLEELKWIDKPNPSINSANLMDSSEIPEDIKDVDDSILSKIFSCKKSGKPYKIVKQELEQYKKLGVPIPHCCPDQRYLDKMSKRDPRHLYQRNCAKCQTEIETTYSPERPEIVYCQSCYEGVD